MEIDKKIDQYHHGNLKKSLIALVISKLEDGMLIEQLSIRSMAKELGVSKDAPRKHFNNMDEIIAAVAAEGYRRLRNQLKNAADQTLEDLGLAYINFATGNPQLYRTMFYFPAASFESFRDLELESQRTFQELASVATQEVKATADSLSPHELSLSAWAYVHGLSELLIKGSQRSIDREDTEQIRRFLKSFMGR